MLMHPPIQTVATPRRSDTQTSKPGPGLANSKPVQSGETAEQFFELGMMCSTGQAMPLDMVAAHKWFNIAATLGFKDAVRLRNEVAAEMSDSEIATAQRAARSWLVRH
jgi:TPR repeat protein